MEAELDGEQRRLGDASKNLRKAERRIKELDFQAKLYIPSTLNTDHMLLHLWVVGRVSVQGVESLWGVCRFIPADWGS